MSAVTAPLRSMMALVAKRRAVEEEVDLAGRDADLAQQLERAGDHRLLRRLGRGQQLARPALVAGLDDDVGEGAADIDGEALLLRAVSHGRSLRYFCRHPRESGDPGPQVSLVALDFRFRGNDGKKNAILMVTPG